MYKEYLKTVDWENISSGSKRRNSSIPKYTEWLVEATTSEQAEKAYEAFDNLIYCQGYVYHVAVYVTKALVMAIKEQGDTITDEALERIFDIFIELLFTSAAEEDVYLHVIKNEIESIKYFILRTCLVTDNIKARRWGLMIIFELETKEFVERFVNDKDDYIIKMVNFSLKHEFK